MNQMLLFVSVCLFAFTVVAQEDDKEPEGMPVCTSGSHKLFWQSYGSSARVTYGERTNLNILAKAKAIYMPPKGMDIIAVKAYADIRAAYNESRRNILEDECRQDDGSNYHPICNGTASVLIDAPLKENAYTVRTMSLVVTALHAVKRDETFELSSTVNEEYKEFSPGLRLRIKSLDMSNSRVLRVSVLYQRAAPGPDAPFVEAIQALSKTDKVLGEGRWAQGGPLKRQGTITSEFKLEEDGRHAKFRFIIVTKSRCEQLNFAAKEIFQTKPDKRR